jgi:hypothetical protein
MCARLARALGLDGNPLRRASDRAEAWIRAGLPARSGEVLAPRGSPAGSVVTVWLTASGQVTSPSEWGQSADETIPAAPIGVLGLVVVAFALLAVLQLIKRFLNWRRLAAWEAAWSAIGPRWTGHRS